MPDEENLHDLQAGTLLRFNGPARIHKLRKKWKGLKTIGMLEGIWVWMKKMIGIVWGPKKGGLVWLTHSVGFFGVFL